jgi:hypothetical protein
VDVYGVAEGFYTLLGQEFYWGDCKGRRAEQGAMGAAPFGGLGQGRVVYLLTGVQYRLDPVLGF